MSVDAALPAHLERVHMVGIGGAGMSGIARILLARGGRVSGSDAKSSRGVLGLRARGAQVVVGHDASALDQLDGGPTVVVTTVSAVPDTNPELVEARRRGIPVTTRPEVLATLMEGTRTALVAGTHGKTSTTSMLVVALQSAGVDPSFAIGGELNESGTNAHHGSTNTFVAEADESDASLLRYSPDVVVVTNIDADHLDFFGSVAAYVAVFDEFLLRVRPGGILVACADDPGAAALADRAEAAGMTVLRYGRTDQHPVRGSDGRPRLDAGSDVRPRLDAGSDVRPRLDAGLLRWTPGEPGGTSEILLDGDVPVTVRLGVPGEHMALNSMGALLAARVLGAELDAVLDGLASFAGVHRRFQFTGQAGGVRVYDDYAHHPTEVRANLLAARAVAGDGRVVVVFQPHLYSRTATFAVEFGQALSLADEVVVLDVYAAREEPVAGVDGALVAAAVGPAAHHQPSMSAAPGQAAGLARAGDVVITMGAGDVTMLGPEILAALAGPEREG